MYYVRESRLILVNTPVGRTKWFLNVQSGMLQEDKAKVISRFCPRFLGTLHQSKGLCILVDKVKGYALSVGK